MAKVRTIAKATKDVVLDTGFEHPALTPKMRQLAAELWALVQTRAVQEDFPIKAAWLWAYTDMEDVTMVSIDVQSAASMDEAFAFRERLQPDYARWIDQLSEEHREYEGQPHLYVGWLPASRFKDGV